MNSKGRMQACTTIQDKVRAANELLAIWGKALRCDPRIGELLMNLKQKMASSRKAMYDSGVVAACRFCEEEDGGSCCGRGIEDKYTPVLLLMNLLVGGSLPVQRYQANGCYFLGREGCCLEARHVICVNYLCRKIQNTIPLSDLIHLQEVNGEELEMVFMLNEAIKKFIRNESRSPSSGSDSLPDC